MTSDRHAMRARPHASLEESATRRDTIAEHNEQGTPRLAGRAGLPSVERTLERLSARVGRDGVDRYFRDQTRLQYLPGRLEVLVPTGFVAKLIGDRFGTSLAEAAREEVAQACPGQAAEVRVSINVDTDAFNSGAVEAANRAGSTIDPAAIAAAERAATARRGSLPAPARERLVAGRAVGLPCRLKLEGFIVGEANKVAYTAAVGIAEETAPYRSLFLHGACGLGKTHLLQGIATRARETKPAARVVYTTAEHFTTDFVTLVRSGKGEQFRRMYRDVDLLCLDDVHFFQGKNSVGTLGELLHTIDSIDLSGARVVMASDAHPKQIQSLGQALISRLVSGMVVRMDQPEVELRERIVRAMAAERGLRLEPAAARLIAQNATGGAPGGAGSVRDLEGDLARIDLQSRLTPHLVSELGFIGLIIVRKALGLGEPDQASARTLQRPVRGEDIVETVCRVLHVELAELHGKGRHPRVVFARSAAAWLAREITTLSFPEIARVLGRPNHSTVITAFNRIKAQMERGERPALKSDRHLPEIDGMDIAQTLDHLRREVRRTRSGA